MKTRYADEYGRLTMATMSTWKADSSEGKQAENRSPLDRRAAQRPTLSHRNVVPTCDRQRPASSPKRNALHCPRNFTLAFSEDEETKQLSSTVGPSNLPSFA